MDISNLKQYQQEIIHRLIGKYETLNDVDLTSEIKEFPMYCRNCGHNDFVKNGHYNGRQRYQCKSCKSTQFSDANTALYNLKLKDKWVDFVAIMLEHKQICDCNSISRELEIDIKTAHQWRHKMLSCLHEFHSLETESEEELDEVYFPFCVKGRIGKEKFDIYIAPDHPDNVESELRKKEIKMEEENHQVICMCRHNRNKDFEFNPVKIQKKGIVSENDIARVLKDVDFKDKTVITDSEPSLIAYFKKQQDVTHLTFKSSDIKQGVLKQKSVHNNNINNTVMLLRDWLKKFKGVSTKYLANYLKWFRLKRIFDLDNVKLFIQDYAVDNKLYTRYLHIFDKYNQFVYLK